VLAKGTEDRCLHSRSAKNGRSATAAEGFAFDGKEYQKQSRGGRRVPWPTWGDMDEEAGPSRPMKGAENCEAEKMEKGANAGEGYSEESAR